MGPLLLSATIVNCQAASLCAPSQDRAAAPAGYGGQETSPHASPQYGITAPTGCDGPAVRQRAPTKENDAVPANHSSPVEAGLIPQETGPLLPVAMMLVQ